MGLEDFERQLASEKAAHSSRKRHRSRSRSRSRSRGKSRTRNQSTTRDPDSSRADEQRHRQHRHHHHRSSTHRHGRDGSRSRERHSSSRHHRSERSDRHERKRPRSHDDTLESAEGEEDEWVEKEAMTAPPTEDTLDARLDLDSPLDSASASASASTSALPRRDTWMEAPSSLNFDYVQKSKARPPPRSQFVPAKEQHERKIHKQEVEHMLKDLDEHHTHDSDPDPNPDPDPDRVPVPDEPAQHQVSYTFGDSGSHWRMTKLRGVYRKAQESQRDLDQVALDAYGHLRDFDDAREEERELDRRHMYGKDFVGLDKPSGDLFQERKLNAAIHRQSPAVDHPETPVDQPLVAPNATIMQEAPPPTRTLPLDQTALNKLKAQMMKAKLRNAPNALQLEAEYDAAATAAASNTVQSDVVVLNAAENRMLAGGRHGEVTTIDNRRGRERGLVKENEDMTIEDMVKQEKRTRGQRGGDGRAFAERIAKDAKFDSNLDYMDENASKLAKNVAKSDINLRNTAIGDFQKMQKILDSCPLCHHEDTNTPPAAPIVSLATRVYMTLTTEPELAPGGAVIVPIQHHLNLLECDDDEWEEMRNFMKSLTRMYHERDKGVIFYENAAHMHSRKGHAALFAVPVPFHLADTAPAYFKEAVLSADEEWSQHKKIIDTLAKSQQPGYGKQAFRKSLVKEMPYFHVWFTMDGGIGHVIEDERRWPKGDLFAREIIGGMLGKGPEIIKKQGRWTRQDARVEGFRKRWNQFDWTRVLYDAQ